MDALLFIGGIFFGFIYYYYFFFIYGKESNHISNLIFFFKNFCIHKYVCLQNNFQIKR